MCHGEDAALPQAPHGPALPQFALHDLRRRAHEPASDRRDPGDRAVLPQAQPHRTGAHRVRAAGTAHARREHPAAPRPARARGPGRGPQKPLPLDGRTAPQPSRREALDALAPVRLETATEPEDVALWNQWVERYHPWRYRQPPGAHLRYWVRDGQGRLPSCLPFDRATRRLPCRDRFIGWEGPAFRERLHLVVRNARFLLFEWVEFKNLASHVLGLAASPRGNLRQPAAKQPNEVYVLPLHPKGQRILLAGPRP